MNPRHTTQILFGRLGIGVVLFTAILRFVANGQVPEDAPYPTREQWLQQIAPPPNPQSTDVSSEDSGISEQVNVRVQCWDDQAPVVLTPGNDGQPGVANRDDQLNGVIDDIRELGVLTSDDETLSPLDEHFDDAMKSEQKLIAWRGTYVWCDAERSNIEKNPIHSDHKIRYSVTWPAAAGDAHQLTIPDSFSPATP